MRLPAGGAIDESDDHVADASPTETAHGIHMPSPSYYPLVVAAGPADHRLRRGVPQPVARRSPALVLILFGIYAWGLEPGTEPEAELRTEH